MTYLKFGGHLDLISDTERKVAGYLIPFGDRQHVDLDNEYFSAQTQGVDEWFKALRVLPTLVNHDKTPEMLKLLGTEMPPNVALVGPVGTIQHMLQDEKGWYVEAILQAFEKANAWYVDAVHELAKRGVLNWSSGPLQQRVRKSGKHIDEWPVIEATLTPMPANPYHSQVTPLKSLLAAYTLIGTPEDQVQSALKMLTMDVVDSDGSQDELETVDVVEDDTPGQHGGHAVTEESVPAEAQSKTGAQPAATAQPSAEEALAADSKTEPTPAPDTPDHPPTNEKEVDPVFAAFNNTDTIPVERLNTALIIQQGDTYFQVDYEVEGKGIRFAPASDWVAVEKHWLPIPPPSEETQSSDSESTATLEKAQAELDLLTLSLELKMMEHTRQ